MEESKKKMEERIEDIKREYFKVTTQLPRKIKKKRRKELNREYSLLIGMKRYEEDMFSFFK
jgi:hypothetical protein